MKKNEIIKFRWENDEEYSYRMNVSNISGNVSKVLYNLETLAKQVNPNYSNILDPLKSLYGKYVKLDVPERYTEFHSIYLEGIEYYIKGLELLVKTFREKIAKGLSNRDQLILSRVVKASTLMKCGGAYFEISNVKNMELFERQQEKYHSLNVRKN